MVTATKYSIWRDVTLNCYEVVRWDDGNETVVQTNILTREKARKALSIWRQREKAHERAQPTTSGSA
jgi:hypothetical protein